MTQTTNTRAKLAFNMADGTQLNIFLPHGQSPSPSAATSALNAVAQNGAVMRDGSRPVSAIGAYIVTTTRVLHTNLPDVPSDGIDFSLAK